MIIPDNFHTRFTESNILVVGSPYLFIEDKSYGHLWVDRACASSPPATNPKIAPVIKRLSGVLFQMFKSPNPQSIINGISEATTILLSFLLIHLQNKSAISGPHTKPSKIP